ncbi:MAG TPA: penicillin-binding protein 2 [Acidimicrobiales bacterium]
MKPVGFGGRERDSTRLRLGLVGLVVAGLFVAMFVRLWYLQVLDSPRFQSAAISNGVRNVYDPAPRGRIVDRYGRVLVDDSVTQAITLSRDTAKTHPEVVARLAVLLGMTPAEIQQRLNDLKYSQFKPVPVKTNVTNDIAIYIKEHQSDFPGVDAQSLPDRSYPFGTTAAQVAGYIAPISSTELAADKNQGYQPGDLVGQAGVEASAEQWLRGQPGTTRLLVNANGQVFGTLSSTPPVPGHDVQLSVDLGLQRQLDSALAQEIGSLGGVHTGAAVVLDPRDGSVLAMSSFPSYDPSVWIGGISSAAYANLQNPAGNFPLINRAIAGLYTPGSSFKMLTATAALNSGIISPDTIYNDGGSYTIPGCTSGACTLASEGLGPVNVTRALAGSDDAYFYNLGDLFWNQRAKYGLSPIQDMANTYGVGVPSGIDLPGESVSRVDSPQVRQRLHAANPKAFPNGGWYVGDNVEMAFGQGGTVITPLQLLNSYASFANGGTVFQPRVAADAVDQSGRPVKNFSPVVARHVPLPATTRDPMLAGLKGVTLPGGTAGGTFAGFPQNLMAVAGKTGTADHVGEKPTSVFMSFAPADNPQYAVGVIIDQGGFGAQAAAPVARSVYEYLLANPVQPMANPVPGPSATLPPLPAQVPVNAAAGQGGGNGTR